MPEEKSETAVAPEDAEAPSEDAVGEAKVQRAGGEKVRRSNRERAMASLRAAKRGQREVSEPTERAQFLLAEANVLALLDVADALGGASTNGEE